jgi:hypothetical protein
MKTRFGLAAAIALGVGALVATDMASAQSLSPRGPDASPRASPGAPGRSVTAPSAGRFATQSPQRFAAPSRGHFRGHFRGRKHARFRHNRVAPFFGAYALSPYVYDRCWRVRWTQWGPRRVWVCGPYYPYPYW